MISIVVTTYNRKECLKEAIDSILAQTYQDFELIIVDNFSNYDFWELMASFNSDKIKAYQNQNHGVVAINRNFGIRKAKGEFIAFCDDDDIWTPNKLELQKNYMVNHKVDIVSTALLLFGDGVETEHVFFHKYKGLYEIYLKNVLTPSSVIVRSSDIVRFDETPDFNCSEDWALWTKLMTLGFRLYQMSEPLVRYRVSSSSLTQRNRIQPDMKAVRILRKLKRQYPREFKTRYYLTALVYHSIKGCLREIRKFFKNSNL